MPDRCPICGNPRHSLFRYLKGWLAHRIFMMLPDRIAFTRPVSNALLPSAGDWIYDSRDCDHA